MLREGTREDFGSATELLKVWPQRVGSERGLRHAAAAEPLDAHRRYWAAEDGGWPMLRVNEKLGYRPAGSTLRWSRP